MRLYFSYPMTKRRSTDTRLIVMAREYLEARGLDFYDPENDEPGGRTISFLQDFDFDEMFDSDGVFVVWSPSANRSMGVHAEIEWARRTFQIPIAVWDPQQLCVHPWTRATVGNNIFRRMAGAADFLLKIIQVNQR